MASSDERPGAQELDEPVDECEDEVVGPVQVGEDDDEGTARREPFEEGLHRPQRVVARATRVEVVQLGLEPEEVEEPGRGARRDGVVVGPTGHVAHRPTHTRACVVVRDVGPDVARGAHDLGDRPPQVLAVGDALTGEDERVVLVRGAPRDLADEAALADPGVATDEHEVRTPPRNGGVEDRVHERDLGVAPDQRGTGAARAFPGRCDGGDRGPGVDGFVAAPNGERPEGLVAHRVLGVRVRDRPDDDLPGLRARLQTARDVHDVAHRGVVAARPQRADEHLAGVHADPQLNGDAVLVLQVAERLLHLDRRPHGALGVVLVGDRRPEQRHQRVADDLVDLAAERLHVGRDRGEATVDEVLDALGIGGLGVAREPDEVREQDGGHPALVGPGDEGLPARGAEPGVGRRRRATGRALHVRQRTGPEPAGTEGCAGAGRCRSGRADAGCQDGHDSPTACPHDCPDWPDWRGRRGSGDGDGARCRGRGG